MAGRDPEGTRLPAWGLANLFIVYIVWSTTFLAMRIGVREGSGVGAWFFGGTRVLAAGILLVVLALLTRQKLRLPRRDLVALWASGILIWVIGHGFILWAETWADSGYSGLFIAAFPILGAVYGALLDRKAPSLRLVASLLAGFAGILVLTIPKMEGADALAPLVLAALIAAPIGFAAGWVWQRRVVRGVGAFASSAHQHLAAAPVFLLWSVAIGEPAPTPSDAAIGAWVYLVVFGSLIGYSAAVYAIQNLPASVAMTYGYVNPVFAVIVGHLALNEEITPLLILGAAFVLLGVWGVFRSPTGTRTPVAAAVPAPPAPARRP